jgi:hypothetical protein
MRQASWRWGGMSVEVAPIPQYERGLLSFITDLFDRHRKLKMADAIAGTHSRSTVALHRV